LPLRFPGQYSDSETGSFQNWMRDYFAELGRYSRSDPIGLAGGLSTYGYVHSTPLALFDSSGLQARSCCTDLSDEQCCNAAGNRGMYDDTGVEVAGIPACCNGRKVACANYPGGSGGRDAVRKCILVHEMKHFDQVDCPSGCGISHPDFRTGVNPKAGECDAYAAEIACLRSALSSCKDKVCTVRINATINSRITGSARNYGCKW
jgi:RHS repeat-associated protein